MTDTAEPIYNFEEQLVDRNIKHYMFKVRLHSDKDPLFIKPEIATPRESTHQHLPLSSP